MQSNLAQNWFEQGGEAYARYRPDYPIALAKFLASVVCDHTLAVDVGCGNGQLTAQLANYFDAVLGVDPSANQLTNAIAHPRIEYQCAPAEKLPLPTQSVSLLTAAQAAHWFDLPAFYGEVRRVMKPEGVISLLSYGVLQLEAELDERFKYFYWHEIAPYWPAERKLVDSGYATIDFPFAAILAPSLAIEKNWNLREFLGYITTWSAVTHAGHAGQAHILLNFAEEMATLWGDANTQRTISWPIHMRIGKV
ncbi:class I SAM-dependent methyltransferase [Chitinibacter sp. FCG-7]|uniref:Class I SAM-dependent methyltransferase n=1 Tax=Chitinibacter mangrovi TaxID=3153927 RepID=A0AAU7FE34_9NEIS